MEVAQEGACEYAFFGDGLEGAMTVAGSAVTINVVYPVEVVCMGSVDATGTIVSECFGCSLQLEVVL